MKPFGCPVTILNTIDHLGNQSNGSAGTKVYDSAGKARVETIPGKDYVLLPLWTQDLQYSSSSKDSPDAGCKSLGEEEKKDVEDPGNEDSEVPSTEEPRVNIKKDNVVNQNIVYGCADDPNMPNLEEIVYSYDCEDTRRMTKKLEEHGLFSSVQQRTNHKDFQNCLFACFLSQVDPKKVYRNKKDERDEVFAPVLVIKAIRLFLAYDSFKDFVVYQMDMKSAFLYGKIEEEVYVCQPPGFEDPEFPDRVYKVEKSLYGLHQAPRVWYETLSTYLLDNRFQRDDIIFGSTKKVLCTQFEKLMHKKFQMSSMGELTFFLGLQVTQRDDGIFISQEKYVTEIFKKFGFSDVKTASTPMETHKPLLKDVDGEDVDEHLNRSMIGSLMYLTSSRPDIMFSVCACVRYQVNPKASHLYAVKRIFRYLKVKNPVFHSKTQHIEIKHHFIRDSNEKKLIQMIKIHTDQNVEDLLTKSFDFLATAKAKIVNGKRQIQALVDKKKLIITEISVRSNLQLHDAEGTVCLPNDAIFEQLTLMSANTTAWNEFSSTMASAIICLGGVKFLMYPREGNGFSSRITPLFPPMMVQAPEELGEERKTKRKQKKGTEIPSSSGEPITDEAANVASVSTHSNDLLLSGEDRIQLTELMNLCTNLQKKVLDLVEAKTAQAKEIASLKKRFKKIESSDDASLGAQEDASKHGRKFAYIDQDEGVTLIDETQGRSDDNLMFDTGVLDEQEVETLIEIKAAKPRDVTTAAITTTNTVTRPKARGVVVQEPKEEEKVARQREEDANIAEWDDVQAMIDADYELTVKLQAAEQGELTIEEKSRLFMELMNKRKKHFARLREEEQRIKPPTKAQKRNTMSTYLKNVAGYKHNQLKTKSFEDILMLFAKEMKRVITFVYMDTELVKGSVTRTEGSSKRVGDELESDNSKKQKLDEHVEAEIDDDQEEAELKKHMEIVQDDDSWVRIDAIPLATKPPIIVEWKIIKEGKMGYFQLIRANKSSKRYSSMIQMLQNIDREYLETLWNLVKAKHENTRPEDGSRQSKSRRNKVSGYILLVKTKFLIKKFKDSEDEHQVYGRIVGIKRLFEVATAKLMLLVYKLLLLVFRVNAAGTKLQLLTELQLLMDRD
ncbi:putative ribonuclease H-like domain-containing protein [Tanacetum coccineum]